MGDSNDEQAREFSVDYDFKTNLYQRPIAKCSMGHEVIGQWLSEEIEDNVALIDRFLKKIDAIERSEIQNYESTGVEFIVRLNRLDVEVLSIALEQQEYGELPEDTDYFDHELKSECGLNDFKELLSAWRDFVDG